MKILNKVPFIFLFFVLVFFVSCESNPTPVEKEPSSSDSTLADTAVLFVINNSKITINNVWFDFYIENPVLDSNRRVDLLSINKIGALKPNSQYVFTGIVAGDYFLQEADSNMKNSYYGWWGNGDTLSGSAKQKKRTIKAGKVYIAEFNDNGKGDISLSFTQEDIPLK